jgi:hypothetical protein
MHVERIAWGGWPACYRLSSDAIELIVTADVGPRIVSARLLGGTNLLYVDDGTLGKTGGDAFRLYGGHRLWAAPEDRVRTYAPDNGPVAVFEGEEGIAFRAPVEAVSGLQKTLTVALDDGPAARISHTITNHNPDAVTVAPWALTVMRLGGIAILPLPLGGQHPQSLLPAASLALWPYTDLGDPRWGFATQHLLLHGRAGGVPQKVGASVPAGWLAYALGRTVFLKQFAHDADATYPDRGCNAELFINAVMLELESLGPLVTLAPGESCHHVERWALLDGVPAPESSTVAAHARWLEETTDVIAAYLHPVA